MKKFLMLCVAVTPLLCEAVNPTRASNNDSRVAYVTYRVDDVVQVPVRRGTITRIIFEPGEQIVKAGTGFPSDCKATGLEWCVSAVTNEDQAWVKPLGGSTHNNLEIATTKRHYSFQFQVLADKDKTTEMYRVIFQYPIQPPSMSSDLLKTIPTKIHTPGLAVESTDLPRIRNAKYSVDRSLNGDETVPELVFDDGVFTYFQFKDNATLPAIFAMGPDGEEAVNFSMEGGGDQVADLVRVHRLGKQFILRNGSAVLGIWNDAYDPKGVAVSDGSTNSNLKRVLK